MTAVQPLLCSTRCAAILEYEVRRLIVLPKELMRIVAGYLRYTREEENAHKGDSLVQRWTELA